MHFKEALVGQAVYYTYEQLVSHYKKNNIVLNDSLNVRGSYGLANMNALFPSPSKILIVSNDHYKEKFKVREIYKRLKDKGHQLYILETSTGEFLDYIRNNNLNLEKKIIEHQNTNEIFTWKN